MKYRGIASLIAALALGIGTLVPAAAQELRTFKYATTVVKAEDPQHMWWYVPYVKGWFKEAGIDFQPVRMPPTSAFPALSSQQIQAVMYSGSAPLAALRGAPYVSVYFAEIGAPWSLLVNSDKIRTAKDFANARCGSGTPRKTATDVACRKLVALLGGDPNAITYVVVPGGATDYIKALQAGTMDAAPALVPPMRYILERKGFKVMADLRKLYPVQATGLTVNRDALKDPQKRKLTVDVIRVLQRGMNWMRVAENMPEVVAILKEGMGAPPELTDEDYSNAMRDWLAYASANGRIENEHQMWNLMKAGIEYGMYDPAELKVDIKGRSPSEVGIADFTLVEDALKSSER